MAQLVREFLDRVVVTMLNLSLSTVIDKIRTSGVYITKDQFDYIRTQLPKIDSIKNDFAFKGNVYYHPSKNKHGYTYALNYELGKKQAMARFEIGSFVEQEKGEKFKKENLKHYLSWTLWPHRLLKKELLPFHAALDMLLKELDIHDHPPIYSYEHTYRFASVKRLEIAADFPFLEPHTFIPWKPRGFVSWIYTDEKTGEKGTTYLGLKGEAKNGFACYGKTKQLKEKGQTPSFFAYCPRTRIESRRYKIGLTMGELHKLKNQFLPLEIADPSTARNLSDDAQWQQFLDLAMTEGSAVAIAKAPKGKQRDDRIALLRQAAHPQWTPGKKKQIWDSYLRSVERLSPEAMGLTVKGESKVQSIDPETLLQ